MADIELVIKIDEKLVKWVDEYYNTIKGFNGEKIGIIVDAIKNGTLLTKGHGRLIDADALKENVVVKMFGARYREIDNAPTIIEAESEE